MDILTLELSKKINDTWLWAIGQRLPKISDTWMVRMGGLGANLVSPPSSHFIGLYQSVKILVSKVYWACGSLFLQCVTVWFTTRIRVPDGYGRFFGSWPWQKSDVKVHQLYNLSLTYLKHVLVHTDSIQHAGAALFHTGISMSLLFNSNTKQFQILSILTWDFRVASVKIRLYFLFLTNPNGRHWTVSSNRIQGVSHKVFAVGEITSTE